MSTAANVERRGKNRKRGVGILRIQLKDGSGHTRWITADLFDRSDDGIGISLIAPLVEGSQIAVRGILRENEPEAQLAAEVLWCEAQPNGSYHAGLRFDDNSGFGRRESTSTVTVDTSELDCYEIMQLSPNADAETIHRVYRILAQRYHPDHPETGDNDRFIRLGEAYAVLSDPERRAKYDARHREVKRLHWKIFDQAQTATGVEGEKRKRRGILALLYAKVLQDPEHPAMTIFEFEELLGCPREHLEATLWYLRGKAQVVRGDNGRYTITVKGIDEHEEHEQAAAAATIKMIESVK